MLSALRHVPRFAGQAARWLAKDPVTKQMMSKTDLGMRLGMDALYGGMAGFQTPGDIGDKLIAGGTSFVGGGLGGLAAGRLSPNPNLSFMFDMAGSMGGDYAGMAVGDKTMRAKDKLMGGQGETPWEKMGREQQEEQYKQMRGQLLNEFGVGAQSPYGVAMDNFMVSNGLG